MAGMRYTDEELRRAIANSRSWRGTLRRLGLVATSSTAIRSVRRHADSLGLDHSHFTGGRRWNDAELAAAVRGATSWTEVAGRLNLTGGSAAAAVRRHAARLNLEIAQVEDSHANEYHVPDLANLSRSGSMIAAAWYSMCGFEVSWPLEPCRYDLVVRARAGARRVQMKTTTSLTGDGVWQVNVSTTGRHGRRVYTVDEVDDFFVIDGAMNFYVIPLNEMIGMHAISLSAYARYRVRPEARRTTPESAQGR